MAGSGGGGRTFFSLFCDTLHILAAEDGFYVMDASGAEGDVSVGQSTQQAFSGKWIRKPQTGSPETL